MLVPLEISYRDVRKTDSIELLVRERVNKLEKICNHIASCHVALERTHWNIKKGNPYRVRIDIRIPKGIEIVVKHEPGEGDMDDPLKLVIRDCFDIAKRRIQALVDKQQRKIKSHIEREFYI